MIFHAILARKHGEVAGYPVMVGFDDAARVAVYAKFEELRGEAGRDFRAEHAEVLLVNGVTVETQWNFPDPAAAEAARRSRLLAEAREIRGANEKAQADAETAMDAAEAAQNAVRELSDEQKALLAEADAEIAARQAIADQAQAEKNDSAEAERQRAEESAKQIAAAAAASVEAGTAAVVASAVSAEEPAPVASAVSAEEPAEPVAGPELTPPPQS